MQFRALMERPWSRTAITTLLENNLKPLEDGLTATSARLRLTESILESGDGSLYFTEMHRIWRVAPGDTRATLLAGQDGPGFDGDGGPGSEAAFYYTWKLAADPQGNLLVVDSANNRVRRIDGD